MLTISSNSAPIDTLTEVLQGLRLEGLDYGRRHLDGAWAFSFPQTPHAYFHFVGNKACWLQSPSGQWLELNKGDAVLLPHGSPHTLASEPEAAAQPYPAFQCKPLRDEIYDPTLVADASLLFYGSMGFSLDARHPLLKALPDVLQAKELMHAEPATQHLLNAMAGEMSTSRVGAAGIIARLADVLAVQIIRSWIEHGCSDAAGWIAAVRHPQIGRVLAAMHADPERNWSLEDLADVMGASRSSFAAKFAATVGQTPARYLAEMRMQLARQWIIQDNVSISNVAQRFHYESEASFSRAFKRVLGVPPSGCRASAKGGDLASSLSLAVPQQRA
jgi:AraC-like DNA-binding protein